MVTDLRDILAGRAVAPLPPLTGGGGWRAVTPATVGMRWGDDTAADWSVSGIAYRCVTATAANLAAIDMVVLDADDAIIPRHPVAALWNSGGGEATSTRARREVMWARAELHGAAYARVVRSAAGAPIGWLPIYDPVTPLVRVDEQSPFGDLAGWRIHSSLGQVDVLPDEVLRVGYPHPAHRWGSLAPWRAALAGVALDAALVEWQHNEVANGINPGAVIDLGDIEPEDAARAEARYRDRLAGPGRAGSVIFTYGPRDSGVASLGLSPKDLSWVEARKATAADVLLAFGYPAEYFLGGATYENQRAAKVKVWTDLLLAKLDVAASEVDRQWLPEPGQTAAWDLSRVDALADNEDSLANRTARLAYADVLTVNEARGRHGLEPLPGGDVTLTGWRASIRATTDPAAGADAGRVLPLGGPRQRVWRDGWRSPRRAPAPAVTVTRGAPRDPSAAMARHAGRGQRVLARIARAQERAARKALGRAIPAAGRHSRVAAVDLLDAGYWRERTATALAGWVESGLEAGADRALSQLTADPVEGWADALPAAAAVEADRVAGAVTDAALAALDDAIGAAQLVEGEPARSLVDDLAAAVGDAFDRVAGTMAAAASTMATTAAYSLGGAIGTDGLETSRVWRSVQDSRTRATHAALHGHGPDPATGRYANGCERPGDPAAPIDEIANCRCWEDYTDGE